MNPRTRLPVLAACLLVLGAPGLAVFHLPPRPIPPAAPPEVRKEVSRLFAPQSDQRVAAALALGRMGAKADLAVPFLRDLILDETPVESPGSYRPDGLAVFGTPTVGRIAADSLWEICPPEFLTLLRDRDLRLRRYAVEGLADRSRGPAAMELLLHAIRDGDESVRRAAVWGLHHLPTPRACGALLSAATDRSPEVRMAAAFALGHMQTVDREDWAVAKLLHLLRHDADERCRAAAAWALGQVNSPRAAPALHQAAGDRDPTVRYFAAAALDPSRADAKRTAEYVQALWRQSTPKPQPAKPAAAPPAGEAGKLSPALPETAVGTPGSASGPELHLGGILTGPGGRIAMINGRALTVGQTIEGARIVRIELYSVDLESERDGRRFRLTR